ncbi:dihydroxy-acid dehydratase family protein [Paroceanicella profunda]|uniref:Dihydroxy-acid dehydratase family protein n=1 Tax=Paroceanicella profunda TaxID=2579971 RepID=A0A5B8G203_9RHOB|nr:IlvD/Edd family dehydratase [Paroceanicella profunda]QDL92593.1 dihydroxy-acid dehydratase family protein [Paroceanicella profunda]
MTRRFRSREWFDDPHRPDQVALYMEKYLGWRYSYEELRSGKPIIGIAQTGSDLSPCNRVHIQLADRVREGIREAGGIPLEFPVHPIQETGKRPTAALDRNLAYMGLVETLYGYPIDAVVLTTGCDKTTPACLMAAATVDIPAIVLSGGPSLDGYFEGDDLVGAGTIVWRMRRKLARGEITEEQFFRACAGSVPSMGHCNTMGTASTMNGLAEALGMSLTGCAAIPAPYADRSTMAYQTGLRIVGLAHEDVKPSDVLTRDAFLNAIATNSALGGSTNAQPHLQAIAAHVGVELKPSDWQLYGHDVPLLVNMQPAGKYLGEGFYRAGGVPSVMYELREAGLLRDTLTVTGKTMFANLDGREAENREVIFPFETPLSEKAGFVVMTGNLFDTAIMKTSVISPEFRARYLSTPGNEGVYEGRAIVFDGSEDYHDRINDPALNIDDSCILVIRGCGPVGWPGSAEVVNMQPPDALLRQGITSLPTIGDGRQSGTADSPSILNASPEAAIGGGLAWLRTDDIIRIDLNKGRCDALVDEATWEARKADGLPAIPASQTPWQELARQTVGQLAQGGCMDLAVKYQKISNTVPRHNH